MNEKQIEQVENIIGYTFADKRLLVTALTHASYVNEHKGSESYEKLEFLGDSILNFIIAEQLYTASAKSEGEMTVLRSRMVSRLPLREAVNRMGLYDYVLLGKGTEHTEVLSAKTKSDVFESILAAIYIDSGDISTARRFIVQHLNSLSVLAAVDYKSRLQEYAQAKKISLVYPEPEQKGDPSHPYFEASAVLDGHIKGFGKGSSKKEAQQSAAKEIYVKLKL